MAVEGGISNPSKNKKRQQYLRHNKGVKRGCYSIQPGIQGFFITCDGGRERQASHEAINVLDSFYEELIQGNDSRGSLASTPNKPLNKKIRFTYSDSSDTDDDNNENPKEPEKEKSHVREDDKQLDPHVGEVNASNPTNENLDPSKESDPFVEIPIEQGNGDSISDEKDDDGHVVEPPLKKQCLQIATPKCEIVNHSKVEKSIDELIDAEIKELGDKNKSRFISLDSGCNGIAFVQIRRIDGDPSVKDIVQHMMISAATTKRHISRFILRVLPVEVSCYPSEEDITRAIKPIIEQHFPAETPNPQKFAVLYDARANTGVERKKILNAVAKCVPAPHKVDLNHPDMSIVVQIVKVIKRFQVMWLKSWIHQLNSQT